MPFPDSDAELRQLVSTMRELGVVEAFGVYLGPQPTELEALQERARSAPSPILKDAIEDARHKERLKELRDDIRNKLGQYELSDADCDRFLPPEALQ